MTQTLSVAEYRALTKRRNKYRAKPQRSTAGIRFGSKREKERYGELLWLLEAGKISDLVVHPVYEFVVNGVYIGKYTADASYVDENGARVVEDCKSSPTRTEAYLLRKKLMKALYGIDIQEVL